MASILTQSLYINVLSVRNKMHPKISLPTSPRLKSSNRHVALIHQYYGTLQDSKVAKCRASLDVAQVRDELHLELVDKRIEEIIEYVKALLGSLGDGLINAMPYDTAWVALIKDVEGRNCPQFPSSLEWIANHQLADGSWGDPHYDFTYDRILSTLACVVALTTWNVYTEKIEKGISYIKENMCRLEEASAEHMTCGFEIVLPALLERARNLGIHDLPYDAPIVKKYYEMRDAKLERIPKEEMYKRPTSLLYSIEGLENLDWEKLLKLQSADGSFLFSPSSTAAAFMDTNDQNCLNYINSVVHKFNGGAPNIYPIDIMSRLWAVDRLQRLGVSRFFHSQIKDCLSYVYGFWTEKGIYSTRNSAFYDIDDTSMGFRLLRMHGYDMNPNALKHFKKGDKFVCLGGDMNDSATATYNLYRASQFQFPGEEILQQARNFSYKFLQDNIATNQLLDKWVISPYLPDEIRTGLDMSWYTCLPRIEARYYLQHYGASNDVWIGKTTFRMEEINNDNYMELARMDFSKCQAQHQTEWIYMQQWYESSNVEEFEISRKDLLFSYFLAAATIFEPERAKERILWAKSQIICRMFKSFLSDEETTTLQHKVSLYTGFKDITNAMQTINKGSNTLVARLNQLIGEFDGYISIQLENAWGAWFMKLGQGEANDAELLVTTLNICGGRITYNDDLLIYHDEYKALFYLTNELCHKLALIKNKKGVEIKDLDRSKMDKEIEQDMQALVKLVLEESGLERNIKQTFLSVVKTYYYGAYIPDDTIDVHIFKVLFEPV